MKIRFALAALALATTTVLGTALAEEALEGKAEAAATLDTSSSKLTVVLKGKGDGVYLNADYGAKCTLKSKDGGKLDKTEVKKDDMSYVASDKPGKAKSASFSVGADKTVEGTCKVVVCTVSACSAPFKISFTSN